MNSKIMAQRIEMQICLGSSCFSRGNKDVVVFIREYLKKNHLEDRSNLQRSQMYGPVQQWSESENK